MIRNLIFDFGKVLVDYDFNLMTRFLADRETAAWFEHVCCAPAFIERCDREMIPFEDLLEELKQTYPQYASIIDTFDSRYTEFVTGEVPGMYALLSDLKARGYRLFGLTNWCSRVHLTMKEYPIFDLLEGSVISSEEHMVKPEPEIYLRVCERFGLKPEECLFTDDREVNIAGARRVDMQAVIFQNAQQFEKELQARGI